MIPRYPWQRFEARILFDQNQTLVNPCLTRTPRTTKGTSLCVPQLQCSMSTHKKFTTQSRKLPGRLLQYSTNKASREWTKEKEEAARTAKEQEVADRRKAAAAKAALTKERKAAEAAAEAEAAKEAAELRQQLKAARKERRASDKKAAKTAKKKKAWAETTAARKRAHQGKHHFL